MASSASHHSRRRRRQGDRADRPARLPRAERQRQMLEVARTLFAEHGYAAVKMEDVADAVGVTKPLLYAYFGNKEQLYLACMDPAGEALVAAVLAAVAPARDSAEALRLGVHAFFAFVDRDRDAWRVLFDETLPSGGEIVRRAAEHRDRLLSMLATLLVERLPGADPDEVEALSAALMGATEALARWWLRAGTMPAEQAADLLIATIDPGLRSRRGREAGG